mgnify:CR=1 FL=1
MRIRVIRGKNNTNEITRRTQTISGFFRKQRTFNRSFSANSSQKRPNPDVQQFGNGAVQGIFFGQRHAEKQKNCRYPKI